MSATGLSDQQWELIRSVLRRHPAVTGAVLFGSRAKGAAHPASDIDLALLGVQDSLAAQSVAGDLEELPLPYRFDVQALDAIQHKPLREHIERVGIRIYG